MSVTSPAASVTTPVTAAPTDSLLIKIGARPSSGDIRTIEGMPRGAERKAAAWNALVNVASSSQQPFVELAQKLQNSGVIDGYETLVSPNMIVVDPKSGRAREVMAAFQAIQGVRAIYDNRGAEITDPSAAGHPAVSDEPTWGLDLGEPGRGTPTAIAPTEVPYGLTMIGAPEAWKVGATGKGLVYGSIDTGADFNHEAIAGAYRGRAQDGTVTHDYNWMDWGNGRSDKPRDPDSHGTHTIGTVLGKTDAAPIGVAPEAQWISAHGLTGNADVRLKALQWMQAPTRLDGSAPEPAKAPDVVGMSWWTGPGHSTFFVESIQNLRLAGIEPVKSAGNKGPGPETISAPGQVKELNAVAAVDKTGQIAEFSSRGPSPMHGEGASPDWKPDFSAPGVDVLSSVPGNKYATMSGTSMAQPHFSGVLLDLMSKFPQLTHDQITKVLAATATDAGARGRDLEFGYGIVNLPAALAAAEKLVATGRI